jgi:hypothetical protein
LDGETWKREREGGPTVDLVEESGNVLVVEREPTTEHDVKDDAATPDIDLRSGVELSLDDLWRSVIRTTATRLEEVSVLHDIRKTEISDLDV